MADPVVTTLRILGTRAYINGARASARAIKEVGSASKETSAGMQLFKGTLGGVAGALGIVTSAAKSASMILGTLVLYGAKVGLEFDAATERAQMGMTTLLGSAKEAKKVVKAVQAFALKAPMLSVADATQSAQMLIGAGLKAKEAVPTMTAFSDTLSAMGRRPEDLQRLTYAFMQMMSKGKITAEELRGQLGEIFPASKLLARGMGISMSELQATMKEGGVKGMKPIRILLREMEKEFGGATKKSADTFSGMMNNIKENAKFTMGLVWKPLFKGLRDDVFPWVEKIQAGIQNWAKGGGVNRLLGFVKRGFTGKEGARPKAGRGLGQAGERVAPKQPKGIDKIGQVLGQLAGKVFPELKKQAKLFLDALKPAKPFWEHVLKPFVIGFAVGLYKGIVGLIPLIKIFMSALGWIGQKVGDLGLDKVFMFIGAAIGFAFGPGKIGVFKVFGKAIGVVGKIFGKIMQFIGEKSVMINQVGLWFLNLAAKLPGIMSKIWRAIVKPFNWIKTKLPGVISAAVGGVVSAIVNFGKAVGRALGDAIWSVLPGWAKKIIRGGVGAIKGAASFFSGKAKPGQAGTVRVPGGNTRTARPGAPPGQRASGGPISGLAIVGERGPELAEFPVGTFIHKPQPQRPTIPSLNVNLYAPVMWKGREVARAVAEDASDRKARR